MLDFGVMEQGQKQMLGLHHFGAEHARFKHRELHQTVAQVAGDDFTGGRSAGVIKRIVELTAHAFERIASGEPVKQRVDARFGVGNQRQKYMLGGEHGVVVALSLFAAVFQYISYFV